MRVAKVDNGGSKLVMIGTQSLLAHAQNPKPALKHTHHKRYAYPIPDKQFFLLGSIARFAYSLRKLAQQLGQVRMICSSGAHFANFDLRRTDGRVSDGN